MAARVGEAVCLSMVVDWATWLFWHKNTVGAFHTPAKLRAAWKSDSEVAPSPNTAMVTVSRPWRRSAQPKPTAWGRWVPMVALRRVMR